MGTGNTGGDIYNYGSVYRKGEDTMNYPNAETYAKLYQKYLEHRPGKDLVELAGDVKGKTVWDLCCGSGEIGVHCAELGAKFVRCVDSGYFMTTPAMWGLRKHESTCESKINTLTIEAILKRQDLESPDVVFCRQAVNYWMNEGSVKALAEHMQPGSVLVFNTFNTCPSVIPNVKQYEMKTGEHTDLTYQVAFFVEVSWYVPETNKVHHVQIRNGMEPHTTEFDWIATDDFVRWLAPYFDIQRDNDGNTALYRCVRRAE